MDIQRQFKWTNRMKAKTISLENLVSNRNIKHVQDAIVNLIPQRVKAIKNKQNHTQLICSSKRTNTTHRTYQVWFN